MPKFIVEREIPQVGAMSADDLKGISQKSCSILKEMGPQIQWVQSYITENKAYCVYNAPDEQSILDHAASGGFPANKITKVETIIDPTTAE